MSHKQSRRGMTVLGTAAAAILTAGLMPLPTSPGGGTSSPSVDTVFLSHTDDFGLFTDTTAADTALAPNPLLDISDMATSGAVPLEGLSDTGFISNTTDLGLFTITTAANPDEDFIAFVFQMPLLGVTDILTSGADPADNLELGEAGIGVAGSTVNTLSTPLFDSTFSLPFEDPFADLFTLLVQLGF